MSASPLTHFLNTQDWSRPDLDTLLTSAAAFKRSKLGDQLKGRSIALVFFNPSMRTRTSFELGAFQLGGHAVVLQPGNDAWPIEFNMGTVMDGDTEEHIAEIVAKITGIPLFRLEEKESKRLMRMEEELRKKIVGQEEAITALTRSIRRARAGLKDPHRPIGSFNGSSLRSPRQNTIPVAGRNRVSAQTVRYLSQVI